VPTVTVLPHELLCPAGTTFTAMAGTRLCDVLQENGVALEHACEKACVCTTCHVLVRSGFQSLRPASDEEEDQLGKAWGLEPSSRLSCQVRIGVHDLTVEIPRYTLNLASEAH
jgi:ferredoxin, 2Fe-2S